MVMQIPRPNKNTEWLMAFFMGCIAADFTGAITLITLPTWIAFIIMGLVGFFIFILVVIASSSGGNK
jgi:uncharacterized membrane protein YjjP (DUF1212 family)